MLCSLARMIAAIILPGGLSICFAERVFSAERELTASEKKLISLFGPQTPRPLLLWPGDPPEAIRNPPEEVVTPEGRIQVVSVPTISVYLPPKDKRTGLTIIMFPGGGYGSLDWVTHVVGSAECLVPEGVTVIGLKYRTCNPYPVSRESQKIALRDAQRAVRLVRSHAQQWGLDSRRIGVAGYSAGANLAMLLAGNFDAGDPHAPDPVERYSCRPDFVVGCSTWHWREKQSPFTFRKDTPPVYLVHATNDGIPGPGGRIGGAPIELPKNIRSQLEALKVPVHLDIFEEGGHGVGHLIPARFHRGFPGAQWPKRLIAWLEQMPPPARPNHSPDHAIRSPGG